MHNSQQNKSKKSYLYPTVKLSSDLKSKKSQEEIQKNVEEFQKIRFIQSNFHLIRKSISHSRKLTLTLLTIDNPVGKKSQLPS